MSANVSPSDCETVAGAAVRRLAGLRAIAGIEARSVLKEERSRLALLSEHGGYRAKFPDPESRALEAVIVNTGGGVVGGDRIAFSFRADPDSALTVSSSSAERVYRSDGADAEIDVGLSLDDGATLAWLPQPTILFSHARLRRRFEVDMRASSRLVMAETSVLGRTASGETMSAALLHDVWRVRRDGRLVFADAMRLAGDIQALLSRPAIAAGACCVGLLVCVAPEIEARVGRVRAAVAGDNVLAGVSGWEGMLVVRVLSSALEPLRATLRAAIEVLGLAVVPAAWRI